MDSTTSETSIRQQGLGESLSATSTSPTPQQTVEPRLAAKICVSEVQGEIVLDISDSTRGLGLRLHLACDEAYRLGFSIADKARNAVSRGADDPQRHTSASFEVRAEGGDQ